MLFFKYQRPGNLEFTMLRRGELYFAQPSELNDAHEDQPKMVLNGSADLWKRFARLVLGDICFASTIFKESNAIQEVLNLATPVGNGLRSLARNKDIELEKIADIFIFVLTPHISTLVYVHPGQFRIIEKQIRRYIEVKLPSMLEQFPYIASFSLSVTNPTMWGHYADAEKGFAIVYASSDGYIRVRSQINIFYGTKTGEAGLDEIGFYREDCLKLKKVKYSANRPKVNVFNYLLHKFSYTSEEEYHDAPLLMRVPSKEERLRGLVKYPDWRYEREVRAFLNAFGDLPADARSVCVANNIIGIIFGIKMSASDKDRAIVSCSIMKQSVDDNLHGDFMVFQAEKAADVYKLCIEPVGLLKKHYLNGCTPMELINELSEVKAQELIKMAKTICA